MKSIQAQLRGRFCVSAALTSLFSVHLMAVGVFVGGVLMDLPVHAAPPSAVHDVSEVDTPPEPKRPIRVRFPRGARKQNAEVTVRFVVTESGAVTQLTVVKFTDPELIDLVYGAYEKAEFTPGMKSGQPVATRMEVTETGK